MNSHAPVEKLFAKKEGKFWRPRAPLSPRANFRIFGCVFTLSPPVGLLFLVRPEENAFFILPFFSSHPPFSFSIFSSSNPSSVSSFSSLFVCVLFAILCPGLVFPLRSTAVNPPDFTPSPTRPLVTSIFPPKSHRRGYTSAPRPITTRHPFSSVGWGGGGG